MSKEQRRQTGFTLDLIDFERRRNTNNMENSLAGTCSQLCKSLARNGLPAWEITTPYSQQLL